MCRRLMILAFAIVLGGEAFPLFVPPELHCSCAKPSACCRMNMCPMKAAHESDGISWECKHAFD
jgi:hypothetical protein